MITLVPPVSPPVGVADVLAALVGCGGPVGGFDEQLREVSGAASVVLYGSARAALSSLLTAVRQPGRDEVLVPAYTCWTVPAAVVRAGFRVRLMDVDPSNFDLKHPALERAETRRLAAVVAAHLFARSCDMRGLAKRLRALDPDVLLIEDAAQAWPLPTSDGADAVLLSFGRGKPLALGGGGALLFPRKTGLVAGARRKGGFREAAALVATVALARPSVFRLPASIPSLEIGRTVFDPQLDPSEPFYEWQDRLGCRLLPRLSGWIETRRENARRLAVRVEQIPGWQVPPPAKQEAPIRLPVLAPDRASRDRAVAELLRHGVGSSTYYPGTLADIEPLCPHRADPGAEFPGARVLADRLLTLPCYPGLSRKDLDRIASTFERVAAPARSRPQPRS